MRTLLLSLVALPFVAACSGNPSTGDAGTDAGGDVLEFDVAGTAFVHPDALGWLADAGLTSSITGLTLRVEEPLKVALSDPLGVFSSQTLDQSGTFSATRIPTDLVSLGVGAGIRDDTADGGVERVVRSATVLYDVALEGKKPSANITGAKAYAIPKAFHDALTAAVGTTAIRSLTGVTDAGTLVEAGFILGKVIDATGAPVAGVTIAPSVASKSARLFYPTADFSGVGAATSATGLFLYVHTGGDVDTFRFNVTGHPDYHSRNAGAAKDACLVVMVYPGTTAP